MGIAEVTVHIQRKALTMRGAGQGRGIGEILIGPQVETGHAPFLIMIETREINGDFAKGQSLLENRLDKEIQEVAKQDNETTDEDRLMRHII